MVTSVYKEENEEPNIIIHAFNRYEFGESKCSENPHGKKEYIPIFGVGGLVETSIWTAHARPIKFSPEAVKYFKLTKNTETNTYDYDSIIGKTVGVIRRIKENGIKIDKYHCPKYKLLSLETPYYYNLCTAEIECYKTGEKENVVIERLAIPELLEYD
jgi:hypothetical protein